MQATVKDLKSQIEYLDAMAKARHIVSAITRRKKTYKLRKLIKSLERQQATDEESKCLSTSQDR